MLFLGIVGRLEQGLKVIKRYSVWIIPSTILMITFRIADCQDGTFFDGFHF